MINQKGNFSLLVGVLIGALLVGGGIFGYQLISSQQSDQQTKLPTSSATPSTIGSPASDWEVYRNAELGFEVSHPPKSTFDSTEGYIRIQNYTDEEINQNYSQNGGKLEQGHYYLEIIISGPVTCSELMINPKEIEINGFKGYRGGDKGQEGDSGPGKPALCVNKDNIGYYFRASEHDKTVSGKILDSLKLY